MSSHCVICGLSRDAVAKPPCTAADRVHVWAPANRSIADSIDQDPDLGTFAVLHHQNRTRSLRVSTQSTPPGVPSEVIGTPKYVLAEILDADKVVPKSEYEKVCEDRDHWRSMAGDLHTRHCDLGDQLGALETEHHRLAKAYDALELWARRKGWKP